MKKLLLPLLLVSLVAAGFSARAQDVINPNHSVVRFQISTAGTNFGTIDIELFDQEKPQTVRNFLRYVYNGVYSDMAIHRLVPNGVLQGGHVRVPNFALTNEFTTYARGTNFGFIANEYSVGPELRNDYGTITMARVPGNPNSASADWLFNLADNSSLNTTDGGYTVFGRVINTVSSRTGTNLLNYFNSLSDRNGIGGAIILGYNEFLNELPVSTDRPSGTLIADLFTIQASILQGPYRIDPAHSIVRFDITTDGGYFGNIDIELFDQEKPETVKNFLLYVHSDVYSNLVLHRLEPNFVIQGGRVRLPNPNSSSEFTIYTPGVNWGRITNEYSVGPELSNDYGTIAMARVGGDTNSASAEFFFNLIDNPHLNAVDGGFTVFGRVVGTFNDRTGTNLLNKFNTLSAGHGIKSAFIFDFFEGFDSLPVSALHYTLSTNRTVVDGVTNITVVTNDAPVQYQDLFTVRSSVIQGDTVRDTIRPSVVVNVPATEVRTTNSTFQFAGTASDNLEVARVLIDAPIGRVVADGKNSWNAEVPLNPGTNIILVRSLDYFGRLTDPPVTNRVFFSVPRPVDLEVLGKGKVTGITDGQILEVGVNYLLSAKPAGGYYFNGWRGSTRSDNRSIYFTMTEGAKVIVRFSKTFLGMETGEYFGVFAPATNGPPRSSGFLSIKLAKNGIYSGRLNPIGASYPIRGQFNVNGFSGIQGPLGTNVLTLILGWLGEGSESFSGTYSDGHFLSQFALWRVQSFKGTNPPSVMGNYTFHLSPPAGNNGQTDGSGFGTITVDALGRINISGLLADNAPIQQKTALLKGNRFPFFSSDKNGDSVLSMVSFATNDTFSGTVNWFSPDFLGGTNQRVRLNGARYTPAPQARLFNWTNGIMTLSGDGLTAPITSDVVLEENGSISLPSNPHNIQLTVTNTTGWIGGTFTHPVSNLPTALKGAVLQSSKSAAGFFPGVTNGGFTIRRTP